MNSRFRLAARRCVRIARAIARLAAVVLSLTLTIAGCSPDPFDGPAAPDSAANRAGETERVESKPSAASSVPSARQTDTAGHKQSNSGDRRSEDQNLSPTSTAVPSESTESLAAHDATADLPPWVTSITEIADTGPLIEGYIGSPMWSPRSDRLAFEESHKCSWLPAFCDSDLLVADADGTRLMRSPIAVSEFTNWSPDGSRLVYAALRHRREAVWIPWILDVDSLARYQLGGSDEYYSDFTWTPHYDNVSFFWSPDGSQLVFAKRAHGKFHDHLVLWTTDSEGRQPMRIAAFPRLHEFMTWNVHWSPDSTRFLVTVSSRLDRHELWIVESETGEIEFIDDGDSVTAGWSPDGSYIWSSVELYTNGHELQVFEANGRQRWFPHPPDRSTSEPLHRSTSEILPNWSPDGSSLWFVSSPEVGLDQLILWDVRGGTIEQLAAGNPTWASWSPSGESMLYVNEDTDNSLEFKMAGSDGTTPSLITQGTAVNGAWSPDSSRFWYAVTRSSEPAELRIAHADKSTDTSLARAPAPGATWRADWSPDGSKIAFLSDAESDGFPEQLWVAESDGSGVRLLADVSAQLADESERVRGIFGRWSASSSHFWFIVWTSRDQETFDLDPPDIELWVSSIASGATDLIAAGETIWWTWSPDARHVAYAVDNGNHPFYFGELWIARSDDP